MPPNPPRIPAAALHHSFASSSRALSSAAAHTQPSSLLPWSARLERAVSWLQLPPQRSILPQQPPHYLTSALFSTSTLFSSRSLSKEEEDLYQALTVSFRTRIAEQVHRPEDEFKAVLEHWAAHTQKDATAKQRTRARKELLAGAVKHKDIALIQKEQDKLELEANGTLDDHFAIMQAWIKCGELKRATVAFEQMESMGVKPKIRTLATMTRAHSRAGNLAVAGAMVQKMIDLNLQPTSLYDQSALLEYYIKMASTSASTTTSSTTSSTSHKLDPSQERVHELWKRIEPQVQPSLLPVVSNNATFAYRTYLTFLVNKAQDYESAVDLIEKMVGRDISPELERYRRTALLMIQRLTKHGYLTEVQKLLDQKECALGKALGATSAWADLMEAYLERGDAQKSRWIYNDMVQHGIVPSAKCKKMFSDLQVKGGTSDRQQQPSSSTGTAVATSVSAEHSGQPKQRRQSGSGRDFLSILLNRPSKPALS